MKKLLFSFFILLTVLSFVSSAATVTFDVYKGTIIDDQRINSNDRVSNFYVKGYTCQNVACTLVGEEVAAFSKHSLSNSISLTFPTTLLSSNGYLLYFYKEGYIGYEEYGIKISGTGCGVYPNRIYLSKKDSGKAEIQNLTGVQTDIKNGTTISISYEVFADGINKDVILDERHTKNYNLEESTKINSWFVILDEFGDKIITKKESNNLEYSGNFSKTFYYTFDYAGIYNVTVISEIADSKILDPKNDSYSFLVNVSTSDGPIIPEEEIYFGISEIISFVISDNYLVANQFSQKTNQTGSYNISSNISLEIFKGSSLVFEEDLITNESDINFVLPSLSPGEYKAKLNVCPVLKENFTCDSKEITFIISEENTSEEESYSGASEIVSLEKTYAKILVEQFSQKTNQTGTYNVSSNLTLTISKDNSTLKVDSFILNKDEFNFEYNFPFVSHGKYSVEVLVCPVLEENITCDSKSLVFVIPEDVGENESYSGISNITSLDYYNSSDSNYTFNLEQFSTKTNQTGTYNVSSVLTIEIYNESSKIYSYQDLLDDSENNFEFNYNFSSPGTYLVSFTVCPNLPGNFTCSQKNITIVIPSKDKDKKSKKCCASTNLIDQNVEEEIHLTQSYEEDEVKEIKLGFKESKEDSSRDFVFYLLLIVLILSLIVVLLLIIYFFKKGL